MLVVVVDKVYVAKDILLISGSAKHFNLHSRFNDKNNTLLNTQHIFGCHESELP